MMHDSFIAHYLHADIFFSLEPARKSHVGGGVGGMSVSSSTALKFYCWLFIGYLPSQCNQSDPSLPAKAHPSFLFLLD